jgi:lysophospholipase L1-like esterase
MPAKNGAVAARRVRGRLIGCCIAVALALSALVLAPGAASAQAPPTSTLLSLGDSISFGYTEEKFNLHFPTESPSYFEEGFTNYFAKDLEKRREVGKSIRLVNDACPGETSSGLIGENPEVGGEASTETLEEIEGIPASQFPEGGYQGLGDWHPCRYTFVDHLPLHNGGYVNGGKEVSQLEEAIASISSKTSEVKAITLNIGSNDELAGITQCKDEVAVEFGEKGSSQYGPNPTVAFVVCLKEAAEKKLIPRIVKNLNDTIGVIDAAGYHGPIVLLGFFNTNSLTLPGSDELQEGVNAAVQAYVIPNFPNVAFANPFPIFNNGAATKTTAQKPVKEQKSICTYTEMCNPNDPGGSEDNGDIHPSIKGYKELAKLVNKAYLSL